MPDRPVVAEAADPDGLVQAAPTIKWEVKRGTGLDSSCPPEALEETATSGKLSEGQVTCLEGSYGTAKHGLDREQVSLLLVADAHAKKNTKLWVERVNRHFEEVDRSNPILAYRYSFHLFAQGPASHGEAVEWAEVALANRAAWTGAVYNQRVDALYKLRSAAKQGLWRAAEEELAGAPQDEELRARVFETRRATRTAAFEWLEFVTSIGESAVQPRALCQMAALEPTECEVKLD